jgi:ketosteroid isomerase-like protein
VSLRAASCFCATVALLFMLAPKIHTSRQGSVSTKVEDADVRAVLMQQQRYWNQGDVASFMRGYWNSPELSFAGSGGIKRGWDAVRARYLSEYPDQATMGHLEFSELDIRPLGTEAALVLGRWHLTRRSGDVGGVFTLVFQHFPDGWRIIHDHTSSDSPPLH